MNAEKDVFDIYSEVSNSEELNVGEVPLLVFRVTGCTVVTLLVGFTIILYVTTGMFHVDCLAQICSESCIFIAYMLLLLTTTQSFQISKDICLSIAVFLHFLFVSASFFLMLEAFCMCQTRVSSFYKILPLTVTKLLLAGWLCPAMITGVSAIVWFKEYTTKRNCWLDVDQSPFWPTMIPIMASICIQYLLILVTLCTSDGSISLSETQYKRAKCYRTTRWASGIVSLMLTLSWFFGVQAYHTGLESYYAAFIVSSILLGVCIFILRISTDDEIREKITEHIMCLIFPNNRVTVFKRKSISFSQRNYSAAILDSMRKGSLENKHINGNVILHK